jgi:hypothetical protein
LQGNIIVDFEDKSDFVDGVARLEVKIKEDKYFLEMTKNVGDKTYSLPIKSSLLNSECVMTCQIVIDQPTESEETPVFKSDTFNLPCRKSINAVEKIPEQYPQWVDRVNGDIAEIQKKLEVAVSPDGVTVISEAEITNLFS